ncbi:MAG: hypothetical protein V9G04_11860 [Nocardioides sp.]
MAAIVEVLTDAQLFTEMERENRERQDLSPWEQGVMYKRAIDDGLFPSLRRLATSIGAQVGNVSTAIQLASLPPEVIEAFPSPLSLQFRWGTALKAAIDKSPDDVLAQARELAAMTPKLAGQGGPCTTHRRGCLDYTRGSGADHIQGQGCRFLGQGPKGQRLRSDQSGRLVCCQREAIAGVPGEALRLSFC